MVCVLQADIMEVGLLIVARTDSEAAKYLDCNVDPRDHPFIVGVWSEGSGPEQTNSFPDAVATVLKVRSPSKPWQPLHDPQHTRMHYLPL